MAPELNHSTGRGGAGNIGPGEGVYTDGNIVREGFADDTTQPHSSGRGGAGNISHPAAHHNHHNGHEADHQHQHEHQHGKHAGGGHHENTHVGAGGAGEVSTDYVPETAMRPADQAGYENFHTGRGGEGNIHRDRFGGHSGPQHQGGAASLKDKAKHAVGLDHHHGHAHGQHEGGQHGGK